MKAERRHELKHNELSDWLGAQMETYQPHATAILLGAVALLAAVIGSIWYFGTEDSASAQGWSKYFAAVNDREPAKVLETLVSQRTGTPAAQWALQAAGDMLVSQGAAMLHTDRAEAQKLLQRAEASYKQIENATDPMLKSRARLGLAKVYESLCKPEEARKYYDLVAEANKNEAIGKAARADAKRLKDARQVAFLEWFAKQEPKRPAPLSGLGGGLPGLPSSLPDRPDISLPGGAGLSGAGLSGASFGDAGLGGIGSAVPPSETPPAFPPPATTRPTPTPSRTTRRQQPPNRTLPHRAKRRLLNRRPKKRSPMSKSLPTIRPA